MSKLNPKQTIDSRFDTTNPLPGGMGSAVQKNIELLRRVTLANLLWENNAYIDGISVSDEIARLINECEPKEVADLVIELRQKQKLRHTPIFMIVEMLKYAKFNKYIANCVEKVCTRADMMTDLVALYWKDGRKMLPNQLKKGLERCFNRFNEYQLAKYDRSKSVKLRDVLFMTHAKPAPGKEELFKKVANRTLDTPDTWEVELSRTGNNPETWTRLINENKIGGLAMLRNISNMMKADVPKEVIEKGLSNLKNSMLLPLDYVKAANMNREFKRQIENAMVEAYKNLPKLPGKTLFILDRSGSMDSAISVKSIFTRQDVANAMALLASFQCEKFDLAITAGSDYKSIHSTEYLKYPSKGFDLFNQIEKSDVGVGGIFTRQCLKWCYENIGTEFDRIIVFSDSQDCDRKNKVPKPFGKNNYIVDVSSHKNGINYKGVWTAEVSGWSEHFLTYIAALEGLENTFVEE